MVHKNSLINVFIKVSTKAASRMALGVILGQMDNITMESG
jgi:hypothetical protein